VKAADGCRDLYGLGLQAVEASADDPVTLARRGFQPVTVRDGDVSMHVADQAGVLERGGHCADGRTLHTKHHCQKLVTQTKIPLVHPVMRHQ